MCICMLTFHATGQSAELANFTFVGHVEHQPEIALNIFGADAGWEPVPGQTFEGRFTVDLSRLTDRSRGS